MSFIAISLLFIINMLNCITSTDYEAAAVKEVPGF